MRSLKESLVLELLRFMKLNYSVSLKILKKKKFQYYASLGYLDGIRFNLNLPIHSKRTKTNAKTRKK
jgi:ribosomal protein S13